METASRAVLYYTHVLMTTRRKLPPIVVVTLAVAALAVFACSSDPEPQQVAQTPTATAVVSALVESEPIDPNAPQVIYTGIGFVPKRLDIEPGDQVRFVNASDKPLWPASNIHPTHAILPELDSKGGIPPGETWAFTFNTRGFWRFHNHLKPEVGGLVVALGDDDGLRADPLVLVVPDRAFETPSNVSAKDYVDLITDDTLMVRFIRQYGPEQTVQLLKESENYIEVDCHQRAHDLGRAAYEEYGAAAFALSGHECQAGSFHGATEALFATRGTANLEEDVATICAVADNPFFRHQCVHGVGHGLLAWTTYELHDALPLCDRMPTDGDRRSCYSGVFMENVVGGLTGQMGHITQYLKEDDPHYPCDSVDARYQVPCYFYQTSHMLNVFDRDYLKVAQACTEAPEEAQWNCFQSYGRDVGNVTRKDPETSILYCSYAPAGRSRIACIEGAAQDRFWEKTGADDALEMCGLVQNAEEKHACYWTIIVRARDVLGTDEEYDSFCAKIGEQWRRMCDDAEALLSS